MYYLFLDESGDLGFDFVQKKPSKYFVIAILLVKSLSDRKSISRAVKRTLRNKLNSRKGKKRFVEELKGCDTDFAVKEYFFKKIRQTDFGLYTIILNKRRVYESLTKSKERVYNYISRLLIEKLPIEDANAGLEFIIDKSKSKPEIREFNDYIIQNLKGRIKPEIPVYINHLDSKVTPELQAIDMFAWGILRKYEKQDLCWYRLFKEDKKIQFETVYFPPTRRAR